MNHLPPEITWCFLILLIFFSGSIGYLIVLFLRCLNRKPQDIYDEEMADRIEKWKTK